MFCNSLCISVVICHTHLLWEQGVPSSSPGTPTKATLLSGFFCYSTFQLFHDMTIAQLPIHIMLINPIAVALFVLGILVATGKADRWIAGYNTASEEERAKVNIKRVRWISAIILWISDIYLVLLAIANLSAIGIIITTLVFIVVCIIFTILAATSTKKGSVKKILGD